MKKQLLVLSLCLAVSTSTVLACGNAQFDKDYGCPKAKFSKAKMDKIREAKMNKERELLYNALSLTNAQKVQARALDKETRGVIKPLFEDLKTQQDKLAQLKKEDAGLKAICKQKREVRKAKRALKKEMKQARKDFMQILTKEQKAKFKLIMRERRAAMKEAQSLFF